MSERQAQEAVTLNCGGPTLSYVLELQTSASTDLEGLIFGVASSQINEIVDDRKGSQTRQSEIGASALSRAALHVHVADLCPRSHSTLPQDRPAQQLLQFPLRTEPGPLEVVHFQEARSAGGSL